jgi:hypothetical protein
MRDVKSDSELRLFEDLEPDYEESPSLDFLVMSKQKLIRILKGIGAQKDLVVFKKKVLSLKESVANGNGNRTDLFSIGENTETTSLRRDVLISELNQILEAHTAERAKYY